MKASKIAAVGGGNNPSVPVKSNPKDEIYRTKKIVRVQTGVTDGKTGKNAVYVYEKLPTEAGFDPKKHRETVYEENLDHLRKTSEYQNYRKGEVNNPNNTYNKKK